MGKRIKFEFSDEQMKKYTQWCEQVTKDIKPDDVGIKDYFLFVPASAGVGVKVVCGEHQLDLTEYGKLNNKRNNG